MHSLKKTDCWTGFNFDPRKIKVVTAKARLVCLIRNIVQLVLGKIWSLGWVVCHPVLLLLVYLVGFKEKEIYIKFFWGSGEVSWWQVKLSGGNKTGREVGQSWMLGTRKFPKFPRKIRYQKNETGNADLYFILVIWLSLKKENWGGWVHQIVEGGQGNKLVDELMYISFMCINLLKLSYNKKVGSHTTLP